MQHEEQMISLIDLLKILYRRRYLFLFSLLILLAFSVATVFFMPKKHYVSQVITLSHYVANGKVQYVDSTQIVSKKTEALYLSPYPESGITVNQYQAKPLSDKSSASPELIPGKVFLAATVSLSALPVFQTVAKKIMGNVVRDSNIDTFISHTKEIITNLQQQQALLIKKISFQQQSIASTQKQLKSLSVDSNQEDTAILIQVKRSALEQAILQQQEVLWRWKQQRLTNEQKLSDLKQQLSSLKPASLSEPVISPYLASSVKIKAVLFFILSLVLSLLLVFFVDFLLTAKNNRNGVS